MNPTWFGDSYDIVKRFFVDVAKAQGYAVYADAMLTSKWRPSLARFFRFLGAANANGAEVSQPSALFLDPDTGMGNRSSRRHVDVQAIAKNLEGHDLVFVFDQAFSRAVPAREQLKRKLRKCRALGLYAFYYDSHARFLFCARSAKRLNAFRKALTRTGLPESRIVSL